MNLQKFDLPVVTVGKPVNCVPATPDSFAFWCCVFFTHPETRQSQKTHTHLPVTPYTAQPTNERDNDIPAGDEEHSGFIFSRPIFSVFSVPSAIKILEYINKNISCPWSLIKSVTAPISVVFISSALVRALKYTHKRVFYGECLNKV